MLVENVIPSEVREALPLILDFLITILKKQSADELKRIYKQDKKTINLEESSSSDDSDEESEEKEIEKPERKTRTANMMDTESHQRYNFLIFSNNLPGKHQKTH